jgi:hypothetical protein
MKMSTRKLLHQRVPRNQTRIGSDAYNEYHVTQARHQVFYLRNTM